MRTLLAAALLFGLAGAADPAHADRRIALVIGNSAYEGVPALVKPAKDAEAMAKMFRDAGFDVVDHRHDLNILEIRRAIREFAVMAKSADTAVVYYAGHGIEVNGANYLIPIDASLRSDFDVEDETMSLDRVITTLEPVKRLKLVILDCCGDNPFNQNMRRTTAARSIGRGLARTEPPTSDTWVAFAAKDGAVPAEGDGPNSPYTAALLKYLPEPGLDLRVALNRVRDDVLKATGNRQEPYVYGAVGGSEIYLVPPKTPPVVAAPPAVNSTNPISGNARQDYALAERIGTQEAYESFLGAYPTGFHSNLARAARDKIIAANAGFAARQPPPASQPAGPPVAQPAGPPVAQSAGPPVAQSAGPPVAQPANTVVATVNPNPDPRELARSLQTELRRVGCFPVPVNGIWNDASRTAVGRFNKHAGLRLDATGPSMAAIDAVKSQGTRVCPTECDRGFRPSGDVCVRIVCQVGFAVGSGGECERVREKDSKPARREQKRSETRERETNGNSHNSSSHNSNKKPEKTAEKPKCSTTTYWNNIVRPPPGC